MEVIVVKFTPYLEADYLSILFDRFFLQKMDFNFIILCSIDYSVFL